VNRSFVAIDTAATTLTTNANTQLLKSFIVAANDSVTLSLKDENFFAFSGDTITIAIQRGGSSDVDAALISVSWLEDK
jgi:hypothetical protein